MDERRRILKMVAEGTVTPEQAEQLLDALEADRAVEVLPALSPEEYDRKMLRIVVDSQDGDKVNIRFPIRGVRKILKATGRLPGLSMELEGINIWELMDGVTECLDSQTVGDLVDVESADGDKVRIFVE